MSSAAADKPSRFQPGSKAGGGSGAKTAGSKAGADSVMPNGKGGFGGPGAGAGTGKPAAVQVFYQGKIVTPLSLQYRPKAKSETDAGPKSNVMGLRKKAPGAEAEEAELSKHKQQDGKKL